MTFTYKLDPVNDTARVRMHAGDTDADTYILEDEEIAVLLSDASDWKGATIEAIELILAKINQQPDLAADWLRLAWGGSREGLEKQLQRLQQKWNKGYSRKGKRVSVTRYDTQTGSS